MRFSLRTLLLIMSLAAVVAAAFGANVLAGIFTYLACLSVAMLFWRLRIACRQADEDAANTSDPYVAWRLLIEATGIGLAASMAFCGGCTIAQFPFAFPFLVPEEQINPVSMRFGGGLFLSIPVGTAAALLVYWITWPRDARNRKG